MHHTGPNFAIPRRAEVCRTRLATAVRREVTLKTLFAACLVLVVLPASALAKSPVKPTSDEKTSPLAMVAIRQQNADGAGDNTGAPPAATAPAPVPPGATAPAVPAAAATSSTTVTATGEDEEDDKSGFRLGVELGHSVTTTTFYAADLVDNDFVGADLSISPGYSFTVKGIKLSASASASISYEYTLPDNENARRVSWSDLRFGLSAPSLYKNEFTGISFTPSISLTAPITMESWMATTITNLGVSVSAKRNVGPVGVSLGINGSKAFHVSTLNAARVSDSRDAQGRLLQVRRPDDPFADVMGTNTSGSIGVSLRLSYQPIEKLSFSMGYSLGKSFKYAIVPEVDEFTPRGTRSDGTPIALVGTATSDRSSFNISGSYELTDRYSISLGMATSQSPVDGRGRVRFPFFALGNAALGVTSINLGLSAGF